MSNLRSDCRDLLKSLPLDSMWEAHVKALCHQIDLVEEYWHTAERKAHGLEKLVENIDQTLRVPAAEYVPAIGDVFTLIDKYRQTHATPPETLRQGPPSALTGAAPSKVPE